MSFVYAKKVHNSILIFADTKITFPYGKAKSLWGDTA